MMRNAKRGEAGAVDLVLVLWVVLVGLGVLCMIATAFQWFTDADSARRVAYLGFAFFMASFFVWPGSVVTRRVE